MALPVGAAFVDFLPRLTDGFAQKLSDDMEPKVKEAAENVGKAFVAGFAVASAAVTAFAAVSVSKFKDVAGETNTLIKLTGGTAEEMSRLRFAAEQSGVGIDALGSGLKRLSIDAANGGDKLKAAGIAFTDTHGKALPLESILGNVAERFAKMPNGIEKNNLAIQLFGRAGTDLIPILNKGKGGLEELIKASDKYGLTLSQSGLDALKKNAAAHKDLNAAMDGLKVQVGNLLMPVIAAWAQLLSSVLVPALISVTNFVREKFGPIFAEKLPGIQASFKALVDYIKNEVVTWLYGVWVSNKDNFKAAWDAIVSAFETTKAAIQNDLIPKLQDLVGWLKDSVLPAAKDVGEYFKDKFIPAIGGSTTLASLFAAGAGLVALSEGLVAIKDALTAITESKALQIFIDLSPTMKIAAVAVIALAGAAAFAAANWQEFKKWIDENQKTIEIIASTITFVLIPVFGPLLVAATVSLTETIALWVLYKTEAISTAVTSGISTLSMIADWVALQVSASINSLKIVASWVAMGASAIANGLINAAVVLAMIADWVAMAAGATLNALKVVAGWVMTAVAAAGAALDVGIAVAAQIVSWVLLSVEATAAALEVAAAWIISMGPIAIVGAAVIALVVLIVKNWDTIKEATKIAFDWIVDKLKTVFDWMKWAFLNLVPIGILINHFEDIKHAAGAAFDWVKDKIDSVVKFFSNLHFDVGDIFGGLRDAFRAALNWIIDRWNGLSFTLPKIELLGQTIGGNTISTPDIGRFASGGVASGLAIVGEQGPELINVGSPSRVFNNLETQKMLGGGVHYHYEPQQTIIGKADLDGDFRRFMALAKVRGANFA